MDKGGTTKSLGFLNCRSAVRSAETAWGAAGCVQHAAGTSETRPRSVAEGAGSRRDGGARQAPQAPQAVSARSRQKRPPDRADTALPCPRPPWRGCDQREQGGRRRGGGPPPTSALGRGPRSRRPRQSVVAPTGQKKADLRVIKMGPSVGGGSIPPPSESASVGHGAAKTMRALPARTTAAATSRPSGAHI